MNKGKITAALREVCRAATNDDLSARDWYAKIGRAENTLRDVDKAYSFNEYEREHGNPDNALEDMEYLDELMEDSGNWKKPSFILARAFYGERYRRHDADNNREPFNPNDEYFTFDGYGNLLSVHRFNWAHYWAKNLDESGYIDAAEDEGHLDEIAAALGIDEDEDNEEDGE